MSLNLTQNIDKVKLALVTLVLMLLLNSCSFSNKPIIWTGQNSFNKVSCDKRIDLDISSSDNLENFLVALENAKKYLLKKSEEHWKISEREVTGSDIVETLEKLRKQIISKSFNADDYECYVPKAQALITGYYESKLKGSLTRDSKFKYPIYKLPNNLITFRLDKYKKLKNIEGLPKELKGRLENNEILPFYTREEIDYKDALKGKNLEIAYVDDDVALFFLHIQGSGKLELDNGQIMKVGFAGSNGQPYNAIGKVLLDQGVLSKEEVSMQSITKYLKNNPDKKEEILSSNPSYVFFEVRDLEDNPKGSLNVPVVPYASVATDQSFIPKGAPIFLTIPKLDKDKIPGRLPGRFVVNLDTGGAIKGPTRIDYYVGSDGELAGELKEPGTYTIILKKD